MNIENVKALADVLCTKGLSVIEVGEGANRIRIEKNLTGAAMPVIPGAVVTQTPVAPVPETTIESTADSSDQSVDYNNLREVRSPLVGVYYASPSPDAEPFVSIGGKVKKGDVLCIIETMKLMNEVIAEQDGEIVDICVKNGDIAEFGQVLFKMN